MEKSDPVKRLPSADVMRHGRYEQCFGRGIVWMLVQFNSHICIRFLSRQ